MHNDYESCRCIGGRARTVPAVLPTRAGMHKPSSLPDSLHAHRSSGQSCRVSNMRAKRGKDTTLSTPPAFFSAGAWPPGVSGQLGTGQCAHPRSQALAAGRLKASKRPPLPPLTCRTLTPRPPAPDPELPGPGEHSTASISGATSKMSRAASFSMGQLLKPPAHSGVPGPGAFSPPLPARPGSAAYSFHGVEDRSASRRAAEVPGPGERGRRGRMGEAEGQGAHALLLSLHFHLGCMASWLDLSKTPRAAAPCLPGLQAPTALSAPSG